MRRDLVDQAPAAAPDGPETGTLGPDVVRPALDQALRLLRTGIGGQVDVRVVVGATGEECITHRASDQVERPPRGGEPPGDLLGGLDIGTEPLGHRRGRRGLHPPTVVRPLAFPRAVALGQVCPLHAGHRRVRPVRHPRRHSGRRVGGLARTWSGRPRPDVRAPSHPELPDPVGHRDRTRVRPVARRVCRGGKRLGPPCEPDLLQPAPQPLAVPTGHRGHPDDDRPPPRRHRAGDRPRHAFGIGLQSGCLRHRGPRPGHHSTVGRTGRMPGRQPDVLPRLHPGHGYVRQRLSRRGVPPGQRRLHPAGPADDLRDLPGARRGREGWAAARRGGAAGHRNGGGQGGHRARRPTAASPRHWP